MRLPALLAAQLHYAGSYRGGLSNHLPMALIALAELGADPARLAAHAARAGVHLQTLHDDGRQLRHWRDGVGDAAAEAALRRYLAARPDCWPQATHGALAQMLGGSFHGVIRVAYALRGSCDGERVAALAYALSCARALPSLAGQGAACADVDALWARLAGLGVSWPDDGLISDGIVQALQHPAVVSRLPACWPQEPPGAARQRVRRLFAGCRDFDVLHLVTGWKAALSVARHLGMDEVPAAASHTLQAAALALWLRRGTPPLPVSAGWRAGPARPLAEQDEHSLKLLLSARRLAVLTADDGWLALAGEVATCGWRGG